MQVTEEGFTDELLRQHTEEAEILGARFETMKHILEVRWRYYHSSFTTTAEGCMERQRIARGLPHSAFVNAASILSFFVLCLSG